jgi:hypothetical protein
MLGLFIPRWGAYSLLAAQTSKTLVLKRSARLHFFSNGLAAILIVLDRNSGGHSLWLVGRNSLAKNHFFNETSELVQSCLVGLAYCSPNFFSLTKISRPG